MPEGAKLGDRLKEHLLLPATCSKGRVSISERLKARRAPIRRESTDAFGTEHAPATLLDLVGGKPLLSIPAFVVIAFELTILFGALATVIGLFILARIPKFQPHVVYDPGYTSGRFGLFVEAPKGREAEAREILAAQHPIELQGGPEASDA